MSENSAEPSNNRTKVPFDIRWVTAIILGVATGTIFGTRSWIREPLTEFGLGWTIVISFVLILVGALIMGDSMEHRRGEYVTGTYVSLYCGITIVTVAGYIALRAPAPFGL